MILQQKINSKKKRKKSRKKLVDDLDLNKTLRENPIPFEEFTQNIGSIPTSEPLDSRMVSVIFAWPSELKAPQRVQKFIQ